MKGFSLFGVLAVIGIGLLIPSENRKAKAIPPQPGSIGVTSVSILHGVVWVDCVWNETQSAWIAPAGTARGGDVRIQFSATPRMDNRFAPVLVCESGDSIEHPNEYVLDTGTPTPGLELPHGDFSLDYEGSAAWPANWPLRRFCVFVEQMLWEPEDGLNYKRAVGKYVDIKFAN